MMPTALGVLLAAGAVVFGVLIFWLAHRHDDEPSSFTDTRLRRRAGDPGDGGWMGMVASDDGGGDGDGGDGGGE